MFPFRCEEDNICAPKRKKRKVFIDSDDDQAEQVELTLERYILSIVFEFWLWRVSRACLKSLYTRGYRINLLIKRTLDCSCCFMFKYIQVSAK